MILPDSARRHVSHDGAVMVKAARVFSWCGLGCLILSMVCGLALDARASSLNYKVGSISYLGKYSAAWWDVTGSFLFAERMFPNDNNCVHISTIQPDGTPIKCLTCGHPWLRTTSAGHPNQSPDGRWLLFIAKDPFAFWSPCAIGPGQGVQHELWVMDLHSPFPHYVYKLYDIDPSQGGVLLPKFSHDGKRIAWTDYEGSSSAGTIFGDWRIAVANFVSFPWPHLTNTVYYDTARRQNGFYELQGWGPDDTWLYMACEDVSGQLTWGLDICRMDLPSGAITRLTHTSGQNGEKKFYDEQAALSPWGDAIAYMSSNPAEHPASDESIFSLLSLHEWTTDLWLMNPDGSDPIRLTFFNRSGDLHHDIVAPFEGTGRTLVTVSSWHPDATRIVLGAQFFGHSGEPSNRDRLFMLELQINEQ